MSPTPSSATVLFSETIESGHTTQQLIPLSMLVDNSCISTIPNTTLTGSTALQISNLVHQLSKLEHAKTQHVVAIGDHVEFAAKLLLNMSCDYTVTVVAQTNQQRLDMNAYVNQPNLFRSFFFDPPIPNDLYNMLGDYDVVLYTSFQAFDQAPHRGHKGLTVCVSIPATVDIVNAFDVHEYLTDRLIIDNINTLITPTGKHFAVIGKAK